MTKTQFRAAHSAARLLVGSFNCPRYRGWEIASHILGLEGWGSLSSTMYSKPAQDHPLADRLTHFKASKKLASSSRTVKALTYRNG